jgi:HlyD family secretion protein
MTQASGERRVVTARTILYAAVALVVIAGIAMAMRPEAIVVETAEVQEGALRVTVDAEGKTRVRDRYVVTAPVGGRLERVPLDVGDSVRRGDVVARIGPTPLDEPAARQARAELDAARATASETATRVRLAEAALAQARRDEGRTRRLHGAGGVAPRALEEAELLAATRADELAAAHDQVRVAAAQVQQAQAALLHVGARGGGAVVPVRAPASGRILRLAGHSERIVAPGMTLVEIGDTRALEVVVDVLSSDASHIEGGMPVLLEGWGGEVALEGTVRLVEPAASTRISALGVEEQRVDVIVDLRDPPAALGDGFRLDARIVVWEQATVLTVPASALVRDGASWGVFVVDQGRATRRPVTIGRLGETSAQVVAGVARGDRVIVLPSDKVRDGVRVERAK